MSNRILLLPLLILLINPYVTMVNAAELIILAKLSPSPHINQVNAYESYIYNVTAKNKGLMVMPGEPVDESGTLRYTGRAIISMRLTVRGRGGYDFGQSTTGYITPILDEFEFSESISLPNNDTIACVFFNQTFTKDAYEYGLKPYEDIEVTVKVEAHLELYNLTMGPTKTFEGPKVGEYMIVYGLIDETKIAYVEGKLMDMVEEVKPLRSISRLEYVDADLFLGMLDDMNSSIREGDYVGALKIFKRYDEKYRLSLISSLTKEANQSRLRADTITDLEWRITQLESTLEEQGNRLQLELDQAQAKYLTLSQTYLKEQAELEAAKQNLTTAITFVFLASIAFFFLGRRTATGKLFERVRKHQVVDGDEATPSVRGDAS